MKLTLRAAAARDIDGIFDYRVARYGKDRAEAYVRRIDATAQRLLDHPKLGTDVEARPGIRTIGVSEHRIFYRLERNAVIIIRVLHKAMDVPRHL